MSRWIQVDQKTVNPPRLERHQGVNLQVMVSPYDVPEAIRGEYDQGIKKFVVELKYLSAEEPPYEKLTKGGGIVLYVGERTKRIYRIEIDVDALDATQVSLIIGRLEDAIDELPAVTRSGNYGAAKRAIESTRDDLFLLAN